MWDEPFRQHPGELAEDAERQDAIARRLRLALPLEKRMNVLVRRAAAPALKAPPDFYDAATAPTMPPATAVAASVRQLR